MIETKFDYLFTYENLYSGYLKSRKCKRSRKALVRFEMSTLENIAEVYEKMKNGKYKIGKYNRFIVKEPKEREIQTLHYSDRIVQHVICDNVLVPYFSKRAIIDNCVCQIGKGMHFALKRFEEKLRTYTRIHKQNGYFLKCDILKYFPSIPHKELKQVICTQIKDFKLKHFVEEIIDSYHTDISYLERYDISVLSNELGKTGRGIPIGNQTSQIFGMFYLNSIDRLIKEKLQVKIYSRYMDDFILVFKTKNEAINALKEIKKLTDKLKLSLNSKTQIFPLKNGVTYLGFKYHITETGKVIKKVKTKTVKRFKTRIKFLNKAYFDGAVNAEKVCNSLTAYHGHIKHGNCKILEHKLLKLVKVPLKSNKATKNTIKNILKWKYSYGK